MTGPSRRDTLRATAALTMTAALPAAGSATAAGTPRSAPAAASATAPARSVTAFPLQDVQLRPGLFTAKRDLMLEYARAYPADRILSIFRANAGLETKGAEPVGGWESPDGQAHGNLRGHYAGHFLSMLAQAYAASPERRLKEKLDYIVAGLGECQKKLATYTPAFEHTEGRFGRGVRLQGTTAQHVALPQGVVSSASSFTLAMWVRLDRLAQWSRLADFGSGMDRYLFLTPDAGSGRPRFAITADAATGEQKIDGDRPLPVEQWCHLAVTVDSGTTTGILYLDGREIGRNTSMTLTPAELGATQENWIGRSRYVADPYLRAAVDDVHLYDRALSPAAINKLTRSPGSGTLVAYPLDEDDGDTVHDASGRGAHARLVGMKRPSHPGYLAAYPETQFILLESFHSYPAVWAPYYTCHKIMRGLLDAHTHTGNAQALHIADGMGVVRPVPRPRRRRRRPSSPPRWPERSRRRPRGCRGAGTREVAAGLFRRG